MKKIKALSLFANVGIAETYFSEIGVDVVVANELCPQRARFYSHLYPDTNMIVGDITDNSIQKQIIEEAKKEQIDLLIATPPCQGMSTVGKQDKSDIRNYLICPTVDIIKKLKPKYVFLENVPEQLITSLSVNGVSMKIPEFLQKELGQDYVFNPEVLINAADYGVPQQRERAIFLLVRKDLGKTWYFPKKDQKYITMQDAIGHLPDLDPEVIDIDETEKNKLFPYFYKKKEAALKISKWFYPPQHVFRQVYAMMHTPSGETAFNNIDEFKPKKKDGSFTKGFKNTYKRQCWDKPAFTVTMYNRTIGSQNNVHPGRYIGKDQNGYDLYSDPRVLTIYELMIVSSLPHDWDIPSWASDHFVRQVIGEGIPPLLVKKIIKNIP